MMSNIEKVIKSIAEPPEKSTSQKNNENIFLRDIARYFRDFLDTDFHRQRLPKRQIIRQDKQGNLTGIAIKKYSALTQAIWDKLQKSASNGIEFKVVRGRYQAKINTNLSSLIEKYIHAIKSEDVVALKDKSSSLIRNLFEQYADNPERLSAEVISGLERELMRSIIVPLLKHLELYFDENNVQGIETIFDIEDELGQRIVANSEEAICSSLNTAIVSKQFNECEEIINDLFNHKSLKVKILDYFHTFTSSDFYTELHALKSTLKLHENMDIYLYIGDLHFNNVSYPLFYLPLHIELIESHFLLNIDPHLYINKKAIDYIAQEVARSENKATPSLVQDRILYLNSEESFTGVMQDLVDKWTADMALRPAIDFTKQLEQKARSSQVIMTNRLYFAAFDKADESLLNDYEALLSMAESGDLILQDFKQLIDGFLFGDPESVTEIVDKEWEETPVEDRLVCRSPIPLNEEQRKIQAAVKNPQCRFIMCSGPPGTGKSHTITAIAFDAILDGRNVLVLSDKTEALDVVEDKLTNTLNSVRLDEDFQNPILRLGKSANTYHKIISAQSIEKIKAHHRAAQAKQGKLKQSIIEEETILKNQLKSMVSAYQSIDIQSIFSLQQNEAKLDTVIDEVFPVINDDDAIHAIDDLRNLINFLQTDNYIVLKTLRGAGSELTIETLETLIQVYPYSNDQAFLTNEAVEAFKFFNQFNDHQVDKLAAVIRQYEEVRYPLIGFFLTRRKARLIDEELAQHFDCSSTLDAHRKLELLKSSYVLLSQLNQILVQAFGHGRYLCYVFQLIVNQLNLKKLDVSSIQTQIINIKQLIKKYPDFAERIGLSENNLTEWAGESTTGNNKILLQVLEYQKQYESIRKKFAVLPKFDYSGQKAKLENLHARVLANTIDKRVVNFHENKRTTAKTIRTIIRKKQKFPKEQFDDLKQAFPCVIANIRDYAEYMPLAAGLFDVIIIDEASQVSIAQAFPAILRAKKMVVLGDAKQFSNVKTTNASKAINNQYLNTIRDNFNRNYNPDTNVLNRLHMFNIKTSILDFVDMIANHGAMLKKHFRGYKEHISYSSKYFYSGQLQAVKVRGKSIEDTIEFTMLENDGKTSIHGNANEQEGEFIFSKLEALFELEDPPSVGIITPFTDQQRYLANKCNNHTRGQAFYEKLKLKIMTFDSCQGEERQYIFYSMVATPSYDRLYGIFPKSFEGAGDPEQTLRLQRLNVGFSRVQEKMHFVLSKPIEKFSGALGEALRHFQFVLEKAKSMPTAEDVDPKSPMEAKVLDWIEQTEFYQQHAKQIEIFPQFPIGEYLKQLDHEYNHPAYRADFLIKLKVKENVYHLIIEYDGFKEHFTNLDEVDAQNYHQYYKSEDVEREKTLESYGYKVLRINRFNMGKDPIVTLSNRLNRLTHDIMRTGSPHELVHQMGTVAGELVTGERRQCKRCGQAKPLEEFKDENLKRGFGLICQKCKNNKNPSKSKRRSKAKGKATFIDVKVSCPRCDMPMVLRDGKYGKFYGCSSFPRCRGTRQL